MKLAPFALERFFARYEFTTRYLLCSSDPEAVTLGDLLALESGAEERLSALALSYTDARGGEGLRAAIARLYEHGDTGAVLAHGGAQEPIFCFFSALLSAGDHIVVQFPAYQSQYSIPQMLGAEVTRWESDLSGEGSPDVGALERLIRPTTRVIAITTPNNPTGYPFTAAQLDAVVEIARRHGIWILGDEVYRGTERDAEAIPAICDRYERGVSLGALSKAYGLPGLRIGWISTRDRALYERIAVIKDYLTICNSAPSEFLAEVALRHREQLLQRMRGIVTRNLEVLDAFFARRAGFFDWRRPRAGTTAFPRYLGGSAEAFCGELAERAGVLLLPSTLFDAGDSHVRLGYGRANLPDARDAMDKFLDADSKSAGQRIGRVRR